MDIKNIPIKQDKNPVKDITTQVSAEEFNSIVDTVKKSVVNKLGTTARDGELYITHKLAGGTDVLETKIPKATTSTPGIMSKDDKDKLNKLSPNYPLVSQTINGESYNVATDETESLTIYAPTEAGQEGYILASTGSGAPQWIPQADIKSGDSDHAKNADNATKASQDSMGRVISNTYLTKEELGDIGTTAQQAKNIAEQASRDVAAQESTIADIQETIENISAAGGATNAASVSYNSVGVSLTSANVQNALTEVAGRLDTLDAANSEAVKDSEISEVRHIVNGVEYKTIVPFGETNNMDFVAPVEEGTQGHILQSSGDKRTAPTWADPADFKVGSASNADNAARLGNVEASKYVKKTDLTEATTSRAGLMSAADKTKLDNLSEGGEDPLEGYNLVSMTVNGDSFNVLSDSNEAPTIYTPTEEGWENAVLMADGDGMPYWADQTDLHVGSADSATNATNATKAASANKATSDGNGNNIVSTYATKTALNEVKELVGDRDATSERMGYVILDPNKTFAEQVTEENTIYEIRDEFDLGRISYQKTLNGSVSINSISLYYCTTYITVEAGYTIRTTNGEVLLDSSRTSIIGGSASPSVRTSYYIAKSNSVAYSGSACYYTIEKSITIPSSCVLKFEGGCLKNGTLNGNASLITGSEYNILDGVYLNGTWANAECNLRWWGCSPASGVNNSPMIQCAFNSTIPLIRVSEKYGVSHPIGLPYNKKIVGRSALNNLLTGFYANDDFKSKTITFSPRQDSAGGTKEVSAIFYHRDLTMLELHDLYIDANYKADFAIEHIDLYGAPHLFDLYIMNARKVGLLQYAAEMPIYDHLYITGCHIGMLISVNRFDENYTPMTSSYYSGEKVGMPNLVSLSKARFLYNNYGLICNGLYDMRAEDLETAYNSIAGVVMYNTRVDITKYYSEGDSSCDFYIKEGVDENGTSAWGQVKYYTHEILGDVERVLKNAASAEGQKYSQKKGYTLPSLITANLDGKEYGGCLAAKQAKGILRTSMYSFNTNLNITSAFISFHPRSYIYNNSPSYENFTTREAGGIDAMLLVDGGTCYIGFLNKYVINNGTSSALYASILCNMTYGADINVITANHAVEVLPIERGDLKGNSSKNSERTWRISYGDCRRIDFNHDIETARRDLDYQLKNEMAATYVDTYDNRPLYKCEGAHTKFLWIQKSKIAARFAGKKAVMAKVVFKIVSETTTRLGITTTYWDKNYASISNYNSNQGADMAYTPGYYEFELPVLIDTFFDYDILGINTDVSNPSDSIAVSHIYFYEIEDGIKASHNFTAVTLQKGTTAQRPNPSFAGQQYFDTTLSKPLWWNGSAWVDNAGATV